MKNSDQGVTTMSKQYPSRDIGKHLHCGYNWYFLTVL